MKRIVLVFGLIAGGVLSVMMSINMLFSEKIGLDHGVSGLIVGYTTMVLAFLMVYFGIRSYRDTVADGVITFGRGFAVGICITLITCIFYVATWEVIYHNFMPDFETKYAASVIDKARASGATQAQIDAKTAEMARFKEMYRNPFMNVAMTFIEPLPVGLIFTLVSAGLLRRKRRTSGTGAPIGEARTAT